ncbi:MAG: Spy/CpxP family protein refolding chaperone [Bacteroidales bacterium]
MKAIVKKGLLAMFASAIMLVSVSAQPFGGRGQGPGQGPGYGPGQGWNEGNRPGAGIENIISDLSEEQKAALEQLRTDHYAKMKDHRNQMGELAAKQRTIMSDYNIDQKAAEKLIDQKTELMNKQAKERVAHKAAMKKVLTEEQALQLERCQENRQFAQRKGRSGQQRGGNYKCGPNHRRGYGRNF